MTPEGLWTVDFAGSQQETANVVVSERINRGGILVLANGHVYGGGISYYFTGTYKAQDRTISVALTATRYNELMATPFENVPEVRLIFSGKVMDNSMSLEGHLEGYTSKRLVITAQRRHMLS